jgi:hypothetical protein
MLSKCANPTCLARFHYLHEGRIFNIETAIASSKGKASPIRKIEHFWLCERCAQTFTVAIENGVVTTLPLRHELPPGAPQERHEIKRYVA